MSKHEHTPGPWEYEPLTDADKLRNPQIAHSFRDATGRIVHRTEDGFYEIAWLDSTPDTQANAALIAAAPDLLAALEFVDSELTAHITSVLGAGFRTPNLDEMHDAVRAAIAKARGE